MHIENVQVTWQGANFLALAAVLTLLIQLHGLCYSAAFATVHLVKLREELSKAHLC